MLSAIINEVTVSQESRLQNIHLDDGAVVMWGAGADQGWLGTHTETTRNMFSQKDDAITEGVCHIDGTS